MANEWRSVWRVTGLTMPAPAAARFTMRESVSGCAWCRRSTPLRGSSERREAEPYFHSDAGRSARESLRQGLATSRSTVKARTPQDQPGEAAHQDFPATSSPAQQRPPSRTTIWRYISSRDQDPYTLKRGTHVLPARPRPSARVPGRFRTPAHFARISLYHLEAMALLMWRCAERWPFRGASLKWAFVAARRGRRAYPSLRSQFTQFWRCALTEPEGRAMNKNKNITVVLVLVLAAGCSSRPQDGGLRAADGSDAQGERAGLHQTDRYRRPRQPDVP